MGESDNRCIAPCHPKNSWIMHPITMKYIKVGDKPMCPINERIVIDKKTGKKRTEDVAGCVLDSDGVDGVDGVKYTMTQINRFSAKQFLLRYYNLETFDDAVNWVHKSKDESIRTRLRVMECVWRVYVNTDDFVIDNRLVEFYITVIKQFWIKDLYDNTKNMIKVDGKRIKFGKSKNGVSKHKVEKTNFLIKNTISPNSVFTILLNYQNKIKKYNTTLKQFVINSVVKRIEDTLK